MCKKPLPDDVGARIAAIIEKAIADIEAMGADHSTACALMSIQSLVRIDGDLIAGLDAIKAIRKEAMLTWRGYNSSAGETIN